MKKFINKCEESAVYNYLCKKAIKKKMSEAFSEDFYNSLTKEILGQPFGEKLKADNTNGLCYFYSLLLALSMPNCELKIGVLNSLNANINDEYYEEFGHGWVEKGSLVFDTTSKQVFKKDWFYDKFNVSVKSSYVSDELKNPDLLFKLGINAVKDRPALVEPLKQLLMPQLNQMLNNRVNVAESLKVVNDSLVKRELEKQFNLTAMKK